MPFALTDDPNAGYINQSPLSDDDDVTFDAEPDTEQVNVSWDAANQIDETIPNPGWRTKNLQEKVREGAEREKQKVLERSIQKSQVGFKDRSMDDMTDEDDDNDDDDERIERPEHDDELFYDPKMDEKDSRWVANMIRSGGTTGKDSKNKEALSKKSNQELQDTRHQPAIMPLSYASDAILSCPSCMTTLCLDCQQHELYKDQFRAMFVINVLVASEPSTHLIRSRDRKNHGPVRAVSCDVCSTEVAIVDDMEVYHFFHVLVSKA